MIRVQGTHELWWQFDERLAIHFPLEEWMYGGSSPLKVDSIDAGKDSAVVSLDNGGISLEMSFEKDTASSSLYQSAKVSFTREYADYLLDIRCRPVFDCPMPWLTIPGLFYGDNNPLADMVIYPKGMSRDWSFRADAAAAPGVHLAGKNCGYAVFMENDRMQINTLRQNDEGGELAGIGWIHNEKGERSARFTYPCQETPYVYHRPDRLENPLCPRMHFYPGESIVFKARHFITPGGRQGYFAPVKTMASLCRPAHIEHNKRLLDETAELFAQCLRETHFVAGKGFSHRQDIHEIHTGWCGGFSVVEAGLLYGELKDDRTLFSQAETMADFICESALSRAGYFNAEYRDGAWHPHVYWGKALGLHLRHASEGCLFLARILMREMKKGRTRDKWWAALCSNLDTVLRDQREDGALPIEVDPESARALDWEGATPANWAGALISASVIADSKGERERAARYRAAAIKTGDYYFENYVDKDLFFGGPYDAYRTPNMEDPYNLLNSYVELYRHTAEARYLAAARACADHLVCWRYTYDVIFPAGTICRDRKVSTYAMSAASVRNRHIQNWDTVAAISLFELSEWTGDDSYARSAMDNLYQSCQLVERGDGALGIPLGGQSEQWYATEFFWFGGFGDYGKGNLWKISVVLPKSGFLSAAAFLGAK